MNKPIIILFLLTLSHLSFGQNTILWKVTDTINNKTSTIVGTFHQLGNSFVDSIPKLKESLYQSEIAIFEAIDDHGEHIKYINSRLNSDIKKNLKTKTYLKLLELSKNWKSDIHKLKPIELRYKLEQEFMKYKCNTVKENDDWDHFDNYLEFLAEEKEIEIYGLETYNQQLDFIGKEHNSPSWKKEKKAIQFLVEQLQSENFNKNQCEFAEKYKNFELDYKFGSDCQMDIILKERNNNWMKILPKMISDKNCFIAVGLFHLYNKCGILEQLKEKGFKVEPIEIKSLTNSAPTTPKL
jgi:uncharacterized protein YbaP (TraB family)